MQLPRYILFLALTVVIGCTRQPATAAGYSERLIQITAKPNKDFKSKPMERMTIVHGDTTYTPDWYVGFTANAPIIDPNAEYTFTLIERSNPAKYGEIKWHDFYKIVKDNTVLYDFEQCEVHHVKLRPQKVKNTWGYSGCSPDIDELRNNYPHSISGRPSLCKPSADLPDESEILVCDLCENRYLETSRAAVQKPLVK